MVQGVGFRLRVYPVSNGEGVEASPGNVVKHRIGSVVVVHRCYVANLPENRFKQSALRQSDVAEHRVGPIPA